MILVMTDHPYLRVGRHNHTVTALTALRPPAPVTAAPHGPSGLILHVNGQGKFSTLVLPPPRHVHRFATSPTITVALSTITSHRHRLSSPSKPVESTPPLFSSTFPTTLELKPTATPLVRVLFPDAFFLRKSSPPTDVV
jgi:hypothetical protein